MPIEGGKVELEAEQARERGAGGFFGPAVEVNAGERDHEPRGGERPALDGRELNRPAIERERAAVCAPIPDVDGVLAPSAQRPDCEVEPERRQRRHRERPPRHTPVLLSVRGSRGC